MQRNKYKINQIICLFFFAFVLASLGLQCRSYEALSLFWPCNAILLGFLIRFPRFDTLLSLPAIYCGMVLADVLYGTPLIIAIGLDAANILFIAVGKVVLLATWFSNSNPQRLQSLIRVFPASILGAAACAVVGSLASQMWFHGEFITGWVSWFCEQVSTSILLLPLVITLPRRDEFEQLIIDLRESKIMPFFSLIFSMVAGIYVGGGGSLIFPLPALMWCAVSYPLFLTSLITLVTGITEITLVASNVFTIQGTEDFFRIDSLASARLGVAAMTISPLIVALSTTANKKLVARITKRADYDLLTGALTRSGLSSQLDNLLSRRNKQNTFYGAAFVIDIDCFKSINDTWGHAAGDQVLAKTVECIRQSLQQTAMISRMGGEEFLVLIEGISPPRAFLLADRLRQSIERNSIVLAETTLHVTVSIGISAVNITAPDSLDEAIKRADEQLYIAKTSGRNRVSPAFVL